MGSLPFLRGSSPPSPFCSLQHSLAKQKGLNFVLKRLSYFCGCCPEAVKLVKPQDKAWGRGKQVERQVNKTEVRRDVRLIQ